MLDLKYPAPKLSAFSSAASALATGINLLTRPKTMVGRGAAQLVEGKLEAQVLNFANYTNRVRQIAEKLEEARLKSRLIRVTTSVRDYDNMMIEREAEPRKVEDGKGCTFQIDLKRVRFAGTETVIAPKPAEARGAARVSLGSRAVLKDPNGQEKLKGFLARGFDYLQGKP